MAGTFVIRTKRTAGRWLKLLEHIQNSPRVAVRCVFKDENQAKLAYKRFKEHLNKYSGSLTVVVCHQGNEVFVFKPKYFDKAVIIDEKEEE